MRRGGARIAPAIEPHRRPSQRHGGAGTQEPDHRPGQNGLGLAAGVRAGKGRRRGEGDPV
jgi:hypothetical protein